MISSKKLIKYKSIKHAFFNKKGGVSKGIYKSLNCGMGSKDKKINVFRNLKRSSSLFFNNFFNKTIKNW